LYISARSVNYRARGAELIVPPGLAATSSTSASAFNTAPNGMCQSIDWIGFCCAVFYVRANTV